MQFYRRYLHSGLLARVSYHQRFLYSPGSHGHPGTLLALRHRGNGSGGGDNVEIENTRRGEAGFSPLEGRIVIGLVQGFGPDAVLDAVS